MRPFSGDLAEAGVLQQALEVGPDFSLHVYVEAIITWSMQRCTQMTAIDVIQIRCCFPG